MVAEPEPMCRGKTKIMCCTRDQRDDTDSVERAISYQAVAYYNHGVDGNVYCGTEVSVYTPVSCRLVHYTTYSILLVALLSSL